MSDNNNHAFVLVGPHQQKQLSIDDDDASLSSVSVDDNGDEDDEAVVPTRDRQHRRCLPTRRNSLRYLEEDLSSSSKSGTISGVAAVFVADENQQEEEDEEEEDDDEVDEEEDEVDEEEFCLNDDGIPHVNGVAMKRGVSITKNTSIMADPVLESATKRFSIGLGIDFDKFVQKVRETNDESSTRIFAMFILWSPQRTQKRHFFRDAYFSHKVFADEVLLPFENYLDVRGWSVKNRTQQKGGDVDISYRRIRECLKDLRIPGGEPAHAEVVRAKYYQLMAMLERVHKYLRSPEAFCPTASSANCSLPTVTDNTIEDQIKDAVVQEISCKTRKVTTFGESKLIDLYQKESCAGKKHRLEHQHLQLALSTLRLCFGPVMSKSKRSNKPYMEKLFGLVFKECSKRRQLLEGLQGILMYCRDCKKPKGV